jgi:membrane-associated HD superfamily phosphohydrolase
MTKVEIWIIIGYLPNSAIAAKLVELEWTPRIRLQNFICNFSIFEIILKNFFLNISIFVKLTIVNGLPILRSSTTVSEKPEPRKVLEIL